MSAYSERFGGEGWVGRVENSRTEMLFRWVNCQRVGYYTERTMKVGHDVSGDYGVIYEGNVSGPELTRKDKNKEKRH